MKLAIFMLILAAALAGCTRPVVKETVIERPVVARETVIERPVPVPTSPPAASSAAAGATAPACVFASQTFGAGAVTCQDRLEFRCVNGAWEKSATAC